MTFVRRPRARLLLGELVYSHCAREYTLWMLLRTIGTIGQEPYAYSIKVLVAIKIFVQVEGF